MESLSLNRKNGSTFLIKPKRIYSPLNLIRYRNGTAIYFLKYIKISIENGVEIFVINTRDGKEYTSNIYKDRYFDKVKYVYYQDLDDDQKFNVVTTCEDGYSGFDTGKYFHPTLYDEYSFRPKYELKNPKKINTDDYYLKVENLIAEAKQSLAPAEPAPMDNSTLVENKPKVIKKESKKKKLIIPEQHDLIVDRRNVTKMREEKNDGGGNSINFGTGITFGIDSLASSGTMYYDSASSNFIIHGSVGGVHQSGFISPESGLMSHRFNGKLNNKIKLQEDNIKIRKKKEKKRAKLNSLL
jgi:hypothetical protein